MSQQTFFSHWFRQEQNVHTLGLLKSFRYLLIHGGSTFALHRTMVYYLSKRMLHPSVVFLHSSVCTHYSLSSIYVLSLFHVQLTYKACVYWAQTFVLSFVESECHLFMRNPYIQKRKSYIWHRLPKVACDALCMWLLIEWDAECRWLCATENTHTLFQLFAGTA